jgi:hypothetical protein
MSQQQLDLVATMESLLAQTDAALAELKATITDTDPEPPIPPNPDVVFVETEADLDAALTAAAPGDIISLSGDLVYTRGFTLSKSVILEADSLPPGRMTREPQLPQFVAGLKVTASDATLRGIEVRHTNPLTDIVIVTGENVLLDRCRILGDPVEGAKRGLAGNAISLEVVQCYIDDCFQSYPGSDSQAILIWDTPGPVVIEDNYLCAGSETIMLGGGDPSSEANVPSHITIRGNTITANPEWQFKAIGVKSRLELKNCRDVLIENNIIEQCWGGHGQDGYLLALTVRNQDGDAPYSTIENVVIRHNDFAHAAAAITLQGVDDNHESGRMTNIEIVDNDFSDLDSKKYSGSVKMMLVGRGPKATTIARNLFAGSGHTSTIYFHSPTPKCESFDVVENTWPATKYGIFGSDTPSGTTAWDYNVESGSCEGNVTVPAA